MALYATGHRRFVWKLKKEQRHERQIDKDIERVPDKQYRITEALSRKRQCSSISGALQIHDREVENPEDVKRQERVKDGFQNDHFNFFRS